METGRWAITKGDWGFRIYDRETKRHVGWNGHVRWFTTRERALEVLERLAGKVALAGIE